MSNKRAVTTGRSPPVTVSDLGQEDKKALCRMFGFQTLYPHQAAAVAAMAGSRDLLLLAGTSYGKTEAMLGSSLLHPERGVTVLIEPLRALQAEMLRRLERLGISAVLLNSDVPKASYNDALESIGAGQVGYVLITPEQLEKKACSMHLILLV